MAIINTITGTNEYNCQLMWHMSRVVVCSLDNAHEKLREKKDGLKKTEQSYKKDEATYEALKKTIAKLEVT